jgi:hypothetical protein
VPDSQVRLYHDPEDHTPTHLMAAGPAARPVPATSGTSFDVYQAIAESQSAGQLTGRYTLEWDDRGATVRAEAVLELVPAPSGAPVILLRLTTQALVIQRRRYVRVGLRCQIEVFRPGAPTQPCGKGWTTDLSEGGVRCQITGQLPGDGMEVIVRLTLPHQPAPLLIAGHIRRADADTRSVLVEFPPEHSLADALRGVVFAVQQRRARTP